MSSFVGERTWFLEDVAMMMHNSNSRVPSLRTILSSAFTAPAGINLIHKVLAHHYLNM
ncbi:hypothetical protein KKJ06_07190 [Xenorhabdus bovienii]|uniref:hypothetical protein n=1 Tax=Xenorhabdus bovienii TaxID=40576 RepID=UPI0012D3658F|nr:hypothetical protein [Xenorhabdus bovienii]MDE9452417.1 hypothetical protein [Xenorhabdus bovienii]MDE9541534.1 hypothetical protein [Xenorhabdus bovienii]MDE9549720.1 hypothetical protein [Xenorhabdus bovienii]MDE9555228.1 hypothetical protein [Xenorhabdus bovienii]